MRDFFILQLLLFLSVDLFGQRTRSKENKVSWQDTTYIHIALVDTINNGKVVAVNIGEKATIYVKVKPLLADANESLTNDFVRDKYEAIIHFLDSVSNKSDTIFIDNFYNMRHFEYLVSDQLIKGNARVFYKRQKSFVDSISHRLERYGENAVRFFYLPDKRPFFAVLEMSGILDDKLSTGPGHYQEYLKEGEKLASIRKE
jgi:hypothetical protein